MLNVSRALFSIVMLFILSLTSLGTVKFLNITDIPHKDMETVVFEELQRRGFSEKDIKDGYVGFVVENDGFYTETHGYNDQITFVFNDDKFLVMEEGTQDNKYNAHVVVEIMNYDKSPDIGDRQSVRE